jgi:hypothetical protein
MAGWDHEFLVDPRDIDLLRDCLRILRRTAARHYVEMTYQRWRTTASGRVSYLVAYSLQSSNLGIAMGEFLIEMRAVALLQTGERRRRLPLRLVRDVAFTAVHTIDEQLDEGEAAHLSADQLARVRQLLHDFQVAWWASAVGALSAADFLETQHSVITNLALDLAPTASTVDPFPALVDKLPIRSARRDELKALNKERRQAKHLHNRAAADAVAERGAALVAYVIHDLTGLYADPVPANVRAIVEGPDAVFETPPMYFRFGRPRVVRR